jgi:hypothetical protein
MTSHSAVAWCMRFWDLYQRPVSGAGQQELLIHTTSGNGTLHDWSGDGKFAVYSQQEEKTQRDLWLLPMDGDLAGQAMDGLCLG